MIKKFETVEAIEKWLGIVRSKYLTDMWNSVKDSYERDHWISAFNFRLEKFFSGEEIGH